jgi:ComF family protein
LPYSEPAVRDLIHALKYAGMRYLAQDLAGYIVSYIRAVKIELPPASILVPIPLHRRKLRERGFNQAELLAEELAASFRAPARTDILSRIKYATPQSKIKRREERLKNAAGLYAVKNSLPEKTTVILVDDVSTTGATLEEAAHVLKAAGAKQVWAFTVAR